MIEISGIDHVVLHVKDPQRSKQFYTEVLGMTVYRDLPDQVFMHAGGQASRCSVRRVPRPAATSIIWR